MSFLFCMGCRLGLLIVYTAVFSFVCCFYVLRRGAFSLALAGLFFFCLADAAVTFAVETGGVFGAWYNRVFLSTPSIQTVLWLGMAFFTLRVWAVWLGERFLPFWRGGLLFLGVWYLLAPLVPEPAGRVFLFSGALFVFFVVFGVGALRLLRGRGIWAAWSSGGCGVCFF